METKATRLAIALQVSVSLGVYMPANGGIAMSNTEIGVPITMTRIFHPWCVRLIKGPQKSMVRFLDDRLKVTIFGADTPIANNPLARSIL
jgi:hypothetical protein